MKPFKVPFNVSIFLFLTTVVFYSYADNLCIECTSFDKCFESSNTTGPCAKLVKDLELGQEEKKIMDKITASFAEDAAGDTCVTVFLKDKAEFRGCAPAKLGEDDFCDALVKAEATANCSACPAAEAACNTQPPAKVPQDTGTVVDANNGTSNATKKSGKKSAAPDTVSLNVTLYFFMLSAALFKFAL